MVYVWGGKGEKEGGFQENFDGINQGISQAVWAAWWPHGCGHRCGYGGGKTLIRGREPGGVLAA